MTAVVDAEAVRAQLAATGRWAEIGALHRGLRSGGSAVPPTVLRDGEVRAADRLPGLEGPLPAAMLRLSDVESALRGCLREVAWTADGQLELAGWAVIGRSREGGFGAGQRRDPAPLRAPGR